jgi:hypothetical protein
MIRAGGSALLKGGDENRDCRRAGGVSTRKERGLPSRGRCTTAVVVEAAAAADMFWLVVAAR